MFGKNISCNVWVHVRERDDGIENNKTGRGGGILNFTQRCQEVWLELLGLAIPDGILMLVLDQNCVHWGHFSPMSSNDFVTPEARVYYPSVHY